MFLQNLGKDKSELFLDIAICLSNADSNFFEKEKETIEGLCDEMKIPFRETPRTDFKTALNNIAKKSSPKEKKMILLESIGLAIVDGIYDEREKELILQMVASFGLKDKDYSDALHLVESLYKVYAAMHSFLASED